MEDQYLRPMVRCGCLVSGGVTIVDLEQVPGLTASHRQKLVEILDPPADLLQQKYDEGYQTGYDEGCTAGYHTGYAEAEVEAAEVVEADR